MQGFCQERITMEALEKVTVLKKENDELKEKNGSLTKKLAEAL